MMKVMWFGNVAHAQWVPCPLAGMTRTFEGVTNEFVADNGGLWIDDSAADHAVYAMEFPMVDNGYEGIEAFTRFKNGSYGTVKRLGRDGYLRFIDPMRMDDNLFSQVWGEPAITEGSDWKAIYDTVPTYSNVSSNSWHMPLRKATYSVTSATNALPTKANSVFTLLIPEGHVIWLGAAGAATGTAVLRVQPINLDGSLAAVQDITLAADTAQPALSKSFSGATYKAVRIYITRTSSATSTITLASLWAQCRAIGITPVMSRHIPGLGASGGKFRDSSRVQVYGKVSSKMVGASLVLAEVEPWAP